MFCFNASATSSDFGSSMWCAVTFRVSALKSREITSMNAEAVGRVDDAAAAAWRWRHRSNAKANGFGRL